MRGEHERGGEDVQAPRARAHPARHHALCAQHTHVTSGTQQTPENIIHT